MKMYNSPEIKIIKINTADIIQTSGDPETPTNQLKSLGGATQLDPTRYNSIFE